MALTFLRISAFITTRKFGTMPPVAKFTKLSDGTPEDFQNAQIHFASLGSSQAIAKRLLGLVQGLEGLNIGNLVDLKEHSVQTATRALKDGADEELVVCGLFHDIGELLAPICHGEVAGSLLRPYISPQNYWILMHHEIFQAYYYGEAMNVDKNTRDKFRDHLHFSACEEFCGRWDEISFDPNYESLPLSEFEPMVIRLLERKPYSLAGQLEDRINQAKASLNNYDFDHWQEANDTTVNSA